MYVPIYIRAGEATTTQWKMEAEDMSVLDILKEAGNIKDAATVKRVFGEPVEIGKKTFIPVAKIMTGFGGGFGKGQGSGERSDEEEASIGGSGEGGGGGGCLHASPVAMIEISEEETTIRPIIDWGCVALCAVACGGVAMIVRAFRAGHREE